MAEAASLHPAAVAFLDTLGTRAATASETAAATHLNALLDVQKRVQPTLTVELRWERIRSQYFSDSLCLAAPDASAASLRSTALAVAQVQAYFALHGLFLRGAITLGQHYQDGNVTFGPALARAYALEQAFAVVPRVVLDRPAERLARDVRGTPDMVVPLCEDEDRETLFVDFLQLLEPQRLRQLRDVIQTRHDEVYRAARDASTAEEGTRRLGEAMKLRWLARYFNANDAGLVVRVPEPRFSKISSYHDWKTGAAGPDR